MSTIVSQTLSNGTVSTSTANVIQGCGKAWGSYNYVGSTTVPTLAAAYNISSITQSSTGIYVFTFTNALPNANYAVVLNSTVNATVNAPIGYAYVKSTSSFTVFLGYPSSTVGNAAALSWGIDFVVLD
jgi:hypothetical protein